MILVFGGSASRGCYCLPPGGAPSSVFLIERLGIASIICCTFLRSSSNLPRHICLRALDQHTKPFHRQTFRTHIDPADTTMKVPTAQLAATIGRPSIPYFNIGRPITMPERELTSRETSYNTNSSPSCNPIQQTTPHTRNSLKVLPLQIMPSYSL